ncbi:AMP-dependent synthetase and ligase [Chloroherpeton thalassium ATCC 35110]|uniref:Acetate--CoA ligase n=1 Tax=Chloroherpeton thalassium (strain ATCC 35110 / GB-78) TaxID=517418 RepID=B3QVK8_CHLT3|nr:acetate--CoA ligase [Chloroherpeton thalassium]ACF14608.1 AMP-dependent synthetase and ligase [Chloroherpeton thalassium ATCC 35110]
MATIETLIQERRKIVPPEFLRQGAIVQDYEALYQYSVASPERFWDTIASELSWNERWEKVLEFVPPYHKWFIGGKTNITINALDRHVQSSRRNKVALIWTTENGKEIILTYDRLLRRVSQVANALKDVGVKKGDRVIIYMPLTVEGIYAMLACARIGAIHSVVYAGMGVHALRSRIDDSQAKVVFCSDVTYRSGKTIQLKGIVDEAVETCEFVEKVVVLRRQEPKVELSSEREADFFEFIEGQPQYCEPEIMDSEDPLFILYTSGTTGKPKGVVHVHGGYMVGTYYLTKAFYDVKERDIFWSTSDIGWIVGHSYIVYGPLINGATILAREGAIDYPDPGIIWKTVQRHGVNIMFTAPTAVRMFMKYGADFVKKYDTSSLRLVACAGEPLNPEAHQWAQDNIVGENGYVVDNWWQTENAAPVLGTLPAFDAKLGKVGRPMPGVVADVVSPDGKTVAPNQGGLLILKRPLPYMMRTIWGDDERYKKYWQDFPGCYTSGDVAFYDEDGYFCVLGRADDVMNIAGHRIGTAEVESAFITHPAVAEAAVIGLPDEVKGERIKGFVVLKAGHNATENLKVVLRDHVRRELGPVATPSEIEFRDSLPKTRSGKIVRRLLKAQDLGEDAGDLSTLSD